MENFSHAKHAYVFRVTALILSIKCGLKINYPTHFYSSADQLLKCYLICYFLRPEPNVGLRFQPHYILHKS